MTSCIVPKEPLIIEQQDDLWIVSIKETSRQKDRLIKVGCVKNIEFSFDRVTVQSFLAYTLQGEFVGESEMFGVACAMAATRYLGTR